MIRKLFGAIVLAGVVLLLWTVARWYAHSNDLHATVVFDEPSGLHRGDTVLQGDEAIGRVIKVGRIGDQEAITIEVPREHRNALRSDSFYRVTDSHELVVDSNFAVGRPLEDRAVVHAEDSKVAQMIERGGRALLPAAKKAKDSAAALLSRGHDDFDRQLDDWSARLPEWKREGHASFSKHLDEVKEKAENAETSLRQAGRKLEADRLRARVSAWIESAKRRIAENG